MTPVPMTPERFRRIRKRLNATQEHFARLLGYQGSYNARALIIWRMESGRRPIPPMVARFATMLNRMNAEGIIPS